MGPAIALVAAVSLACAAWVVHGGAGQGRTVLSMHMRGHNLGAPTKPTVGLRSTASHHAATPGEHPPLQAIKKANAGIVKAAAKDAKPTPVVKLTPKQIKEEKEEEEIWKTEKAMKEKLNRDVQRKDGDLWQTTKAFVDKHDPNARIIARLEQGVHSQEHPTAAVHAAAVVHPGVAKGAAATHGAALAAPAAPKAPTMEQTLKAQLDAKTKSTLHKDVSAFRERERAGLTHTSSKVAGTARAHASMSITGMKAMLKNQLDASVSKVVSRAKQLGAFSNSAELEKRLKAELDKKAQLDEKQLLKHDSQQQRLASSAQKLSSGLSRAQLVREQLTKEMREEDAIRSQLNKDAKEKGKAMLQATVSGESAKKKAGPHQLTVHDLEKSMRNELDKGTSSHLRASHEAAQRIVDEKAGEVRKDFGDMTTARGHDLQNKLRRQLESSDSHAQNSMYKSTLSHNLLKGVEQVRPAPHLSRDIPQQGAPHDWCVDAEGVDEDVDC